VSTLDLTALRGCLDCGKCTGACPVARWGGGLSPRRIVRGALSGTANEAIEAAQACLACRLCEQRCPAHVPYADALRALRAAAPPARSEHTSHCGIFAGLARIQTAAGLRPRRLGWLEAEDDLEVDPASDTLLWLGCLPLFADYFDQWSDEILATARGAIRALNALGIRPALSEEERCCGHDALWSGDEKTFRQLAERNLEWLERSTARRIVFLCPACALAFRREIPDLVGPVAQETTTLVELLAAQTDRLAGEAEPVTVTYHDPCRQGRHGGVYDAPRTVLGSLGGVELREMRRHGPGSPCCGGGNWLHCDGITKRLQDERLDEARRTGAEALVTDCPRCLIHLRCAQSGRGGDSQEGLRLLHTASLASVQLAGGRSEAAAVETGPREDGG
jgi:Fe-S oxidoreductase